MNEAVDAITATDIAAEILTLLSHHAVGLVKAGEGEGSQVLGSGVLVTIEGRRGILTCGHVAEVYDKLTEVGLVRFSTDGPQRRKLKAAEMQTVILDSGPEWTEMGCDLAFTILLPDVAASIEAQGVFLNLEMNRPKLEASVAPDGKCVDAILGLVHELSGQPFVEGSQCISPMQGMFHTGYVTAQETGILTFERLGF